MVQAVPLHGPSSLFGYLLILKVVDDVCKLAVPELTLTERALITLL